MSYPRKLLILNYANVTGCPSAAQKTWLRFFRLPFFLTYLVRFFRLMGYEFSTVSDALRQVEGRFICLTFTGSHENIYRYAFPALTRLRVPATLFPFTSQLQCDSDTPDTQGKKRKRAMTWRNLKTLSRANWEIGCGGHEPVFLTQLSQSAKEEQISHATHLLKENLKFTPRIFAYPSGAYDVLTVNLLKEKGYLAALTLRARHSLPTEDLYQLPRVNFNLYNPRHYLRLLRVIFYGNLTGTAGVKGEAQLSHQRT